EDARGGFTTLTPEEAPRALPTIRARGHEVPREAPGRPLPRCGGPARRSLRGARQTAGGVAGALAGVVVRLKRSRGIATGSRTRDARPATRDAGCGKRDAGCEMGDAWLRSHVPIPRPASRIPKGPFPLPPAAALRTVSGTAAPRAECRSPGRRLRSPTRRSPVTRDRSRRSRAAGPPASRLSPPGSTLRTRR